MKKIILFIISLLTINVSLAGAILNLKGKIVSFSDREIQLMTEKHTYYIARKVIPKAINKTLNKAGKKTVILSVPMTAIRKVKNL